ncbi:hypothetical protein B0A52_09062 [Exophiala mesophila]|uniref:Probable beta-glucosidase G n=1 Tax=Exophiala mesophila TaxID=212818 RepID=A0A438MTE2_EXOME|nr:hypothetical protein B0A52_09062 [Exophiala mesophila]
MVSTPFLTTLLAVLSPHKHNRVYANEFTSSPPVYPSPPSRGLGWEWAFTQASYFVANLTLEEKAQIVTGTPGPCVGNIGAIPRLGFDGICMQDGPLGIRLATYASAFPAGLTAAASWDRGLIFARGDYLGDEFRRKGSHVLLGPVVGPLGRLAYAGRNWEGFSPDPYLTGEAAAQTIMGIQRNGVQASLKHFIANEQETQRMPTTSRNGTTIESVSSNIDDRTMHELYLWPFADGVRVGVSSIMCSYNRINSSYGCQNSKNLNGLLKTELGFQGYVVSDWGATHAGVDAVNAGLDMDMPGSIGWNANISMFGGNLTRAVINGSLPISRIDDMVQRVMTPYFFLRQQNYPPIDGRSPLLNNGNFPPWRHRFNLGPPDVDVSDGHADLIRELGSAGTVLLKNNNNTLPLHAPRTIGVFGNDAGDLVDGLYFSGGSYDQPYGYEYGTLPVGGGSGAARLPNLITPLEAIKLRAARDGTSVQYLLNNTLITESSLSSSQPDGLTYIVPVPEVCLVFLKTYASEGVDRHDLQADWNSNSVVNTVAAYCNNTVVVTHSAGINDMPWATNPNVTAILAAHLPGEQSGNSIVDILYGNVNPSGKLPYTIALNATDYDFARLTNSTRLQETEDPNAWQSDFSEGLLIDYRHFDYYNKSVRFEFGFGLSYTSFELSDLVVQNILPEREITALPAAAPVGPGGNDNLWANLYLVNATVTNLGNVSGACVSQLYLGLPQIPGEQPTPINVLRGFEKTYLRRGESQTVQFWLKRRDLSYWNSTIQNWVIPAGEIIVRAGFSSRDIQMQSIISPIRGRPFAE